MDWWNGLVDGFSEFAGTYLSYDLKKTELENSTSSNYVDPKQPTVTTNNNQTMLLVGGGVLLVALVLIIRK